MNHFLFTVRFIELLTRDLPGARGLGLYFSDIIRHCTIMLLAGL